MSAQKLILMALCRAILNLLEKDIKPRDIMTKAAFKNALTLVMVTGGSTNAVLHYLAMAKSVGVDLTLDDFQQISDSTPLLADLKPSGKYVMEDLHKVCDHPFPSVTWPQSPTSLSFAAADVHLEMPYLTRISGAVVWANKTWLISYRASAPGAQV